MSERKRKLFIVTGPSGVGKGTIIKKFMEQNKDVRFSISYTTRNPRPGEINEKDYNFITKEEFENKIKENEFLEWAKYNNNYYGTSKSFVNNLLNQDFDVLLEIEVQGGVNVIKKVSDCVSIFILPPSFEELEKRLRGRNTEEEEIINKRLNIAKEEMTFASSYKYQIINNNLDDAVSQLNDIYKKESF